MDNTYIIHHEEHVYRIDLVRLLVSAVIEFIDGCLAEIELSVSHKYALASSTIRAVIYRRSPSNTIHLEVRVVVEEDDGSKEVRYSRYYDKPYSDKIVDTMLTLIESLLSQLG